MLWFISFLLSFRGRNIDNRIRKIYINVVKDEIISGDDNEEGTPVPIPNTAVKLFDAKDT